MASETEHCGQKQMRSRRRLLPRPDSYGLRKHVNGDRFVSNFDLTIAAEAKQVSKSSLPDGICPNENSALDGFLRCKYAEGFPESCQFPALSSQ